MSNERTPLGIEGAPTTKASPVGIAILVIIIALACIAVYYYSPGLYESKNGEEQEIAGTFNDVYSEQTVDSDGDEHYDYLNISVGINVSASEKYSVDGSLYVGDNTLYSSNTVSLSAGEQAIVLSFKGLDIYLHRFNSSYQLRDLTLRVIKGNASFKLDSRDYAYNTSFYNYTAFQNRYHICYPGTIEGSSSNTTLKSDDYSFDVKETVAWVNVTVDYAIVKSPSWDDSRVDIYLYWYDEENDSVVEVQSEKSNENPKAITLSTQDIVGYGKWVVVVHHYNDDVDVPPNTASYTLTIDVVYE
ncbi:MAG: hypothetical protein QMC80_05845 [Thermoplasmatales archaeon]|nr:hypothetical protein [Thermoplasmatales archaeon]